MNLFNQRSWSFIIETILVLIGLCLLFYSILGSALQAKFELMDDYIILGTISQEIPLTPIFIGQTAINSLGNRFRPGYWVSYLLEVALFGANPQTWHLVFIMYGIFTCFLFYLTARSIGSDVISAIVFILLLIVTGPQVRAWYKIGNAETWGLMLTTLAIFAMTQAAQKKQWNVWDIAATLFVLFASMTKESFILLTPSLLLFRITLHRWFHKESWGTSLRKLLPIIIAQSAIFISTLYMSYQILRNAPTSYAALTAQLSITSFSPISWYNLVMGSDLSRLVLQILPIYLILFTIFWRQRKTTYSYLLATLLIFIGWIIPQLILYKNGFTFGHYFFPIIVAFAAVYVLGLSILWYRRLWLLWIICLMSTLWPIVAGVEVATHQTNAYVAYTLSFHQMKRYLVENLTNEQTIVIVADPIGQPEWIHALPIHLQYDGLTPPIYLIPVFPENYSSESQELYFYQWALNNRVQTDTSSLKVENVGAIIGFKAPNASTEIPTWFNEQQWKTLVFDSPYCAFSVRKLSCESYGKFEFTVLVPNT